MSESSAALLARLMGLHVAEIDLSLDRTWRLLSALGDPHLRLPPVVHIAGTNGKGSVQAMMDAGLRAAGQSVHAYSSPHLVRFHERIRLNGSDIGEAQLTRVLSQVLAAVEGHPVTFFEATTCAAFQAFAETPGDVLLLEVGLGGRMDTTNVVDQPRLTVITPVDMDHENFLGRSLDKIAREKAGILKRGVPCVVGRQHEAALDVIEAQAARLAVPLLAHGQHWHVTTEHGRLVFQDETGLLDLPLPVLVGPHQIENAGIALAALRYLGLDETACRHAMTEAQWPARMQRLTTGPLVRANRQAELWLDGAHNPHAAAALAKTLTTLPSRPTHFVFGMMAKRDPEALLDPLAQSCESLTAVPIPGEEKTMEPEALATTARALGLRADTAATVTEAVARITDETPGARIIIFGSLYLAGAVLAENG